MSGTVFRTTSFTLRHLADNIRRGDVALPELQRPFVWSNSKVRDLFDSMYRGFPVGYLLFWETGADVGSRQIGVDGKDAKVARWLIVDGQQRMTSLYSVLTGENVVREDYSESRVKLAFRPRDALFSVADATTERNPEFLKDITTLWTDFRATTSAFFDEYEAARGPLDAARRNEWEDAIDHVRDLQSFPFSVVELDSSVDEEQVAEVFVRINSEGVKLNQADFILTLMSVFWDEGRKQLETFSRASKAPSMGGASAFNWYISPSPDQLLRVGIALAFRRAVLRHAYSILRGKDLDSGTSNNERREAQFARLREAQSRVVDLTNWHEYLRCLERAGFRGSKMISSKNVILFTYAIWLMGRVDHRVPVDRLREAVARWFFMAHTTARYSGSFETQAERDFARIDELSADLGYVGALNRIVDDTLTNDFWAITLPNELSTAASGSPSLFAYLAALNILDADALLSSGKVRDRLDPAVTATKSIERHHLFPKAYLRDTLKIRDAKQINQIANMALVEWNDNIAISDDAPSEYWPEQIASKTYISADQLALQLELHALPDGWTALDYPTFLSQRRRLMAGVVRQAFERLSRSDYATSYPSSDAHASTAVSRVELIDVAPSIDIADLIATGLIDAGTLLTPVDASIDVIAEIDEDGQIVLEGITYPTPGAAAAAAGATSAAGWTFWQVETAAGERRLGDLREIYRTSDVREPAAD